MAGPCPLTGACLQICSLMRGGIAERGGVRVGHRIIEINGQSVVATAHEKIVQALSNSVGEVRPLSGAACARSMPARTPGEPGGVVGTPRARWSGRTFPGTRPCAPSGRRSVLATLPTSLCFFLLSGCAAWGGSGDVGEVDLGAGC